MPSTPDSQVITGLFIDICDSTALHNDPRLGRDEATRGARLAETIKRPFDEIVDEVIRQAGGWMVNPAGDGWCCGLLDPQKAVQAAVVIQARLKSALTSTPVGSVEARIGLHCAPISTTAPDYIHQAGNLAARVQSYAPRGGIGVTSAVHGLCQGRLVDISFRDLGFQEFKGEASPQQVFAVECSPNELNRLLAEWSNRGGRSGGGTGSTAHDVAAKPSPSQTHPSSQSPQPSPGQSVSASNKSIAIGGNVEGSSINIG